MYLYTKANFLGLFYASHAGAGLVLGNYAGLGFLGTLYLAAALPGAVSLGLLLRNAIQKCKGNAQNTNEQTHHAEVSMYDWEAGLAAAVGALALSPSEEHSSIVDVPKRLAIGVGTWALMKTAYLGKCSIHRVIEDIRNAPAPPRT